MGDGENVACQVAADLVSISLYFWGQSVAHLVKCTHFNKQEHQEGGVSSPLPVVEKLHKRCNSAVGSCASPFFKKYFTYS